MDIRTSFKIYKSSAGSGKTFTLVKEYLRLVLVNPDGYRNVLAITFTNKAAGEMKERIIKGLIQLSEGKGEALRLLLISEGVPKEVIQVNASKVLSRVLHDYANFSVSTIDSFTYRLIRNFARDLDLPSRFDVETDTESLLNRMIDQLMDEIGKNEYVTRILVHFAEEKLSNENAWTLDKDLGNIARQLFQEESQVPLAQLQNLDPTSFLGLIEYIRTIKNDYPEKMKALGAEAEGLIRAAGLEIADLAGGKRGVGAVFLKLQERQKPEGFNKYVTGPNFDQAINDGRWCVKKSKQAQVQTALENGLLTVAKAIWDYHHSAYDRYVTAYYAYENIHSLAVLKQIEDLIEAHKERNNLVHISDFQKKISDFIRQETPDYIYWRLGEKFRHYLVDEFQDTSLMQWENLYPLFEYLQSEPEREGSLLIVGDSKQAIYRWRGGQVDLLENVAPKAFQVAPFHLETNWRSGEVVVRFNNRFFKALRDLMHDNPMIGQIYERFEQEARPEKTGAGYVRVQFLEGKSGFKDKAMDRTLEIVRDLIAEGFAYKDIALLVRSRSEGSQLARFLADDDIPVISDESLLLFKEPAVNYIISLLRFLIDPGNSIARGEIMHYHYYYLHPDFESTNPGAAIRDILGEEGAWRHVLDQMPKEFRQLRRRMDQVPLYELAEEIIRIFGLMRFSPAYLQHFLDVVLQYAERKKPDISGFLEYWDGNKHRISLVIPEGENAIEVLTIHKSKGLEFPVVIMPFVNWQIQPKFDSVFWAAASEKLGDSDTFLVPARKELRASQFREDYQAELHKTILDNVNLLYVGLTRPRDRLYMLSPQVKLKTKDSEKPASEDLFTAADLVTAVLQDEVFAFPEENLYESGIPEPRSEARSTGGTTIAPEFLSKPWRERIRINRRFRKMWESGPKEKSREIPMLNLLKEALRRMSNAAEINKILNDLQEEGLLADARRQEAEAVLIRLMTTEPVSKWYQKGLKVKKAADILSPKGEITGPDRVILEGKRAIIVEFPIQDAEPEEPDQPEVFATALKDLGFQSVRIHRYPLTQLTLNDSGIQASLA